MDAQFLLKNRMRMQQFTLSNDQFYDIIREFTEQLHQGNPNGIEAMVDKEKSVLNDSNVRKIVLKEMDLDNCISCDQLASHLDGQEQKIVQKAVQLHLEYISNKATEKGQSYSEPYREIRSRSFWEKFNYQFFIEVLNYQDWQNRKSHYQRKGAKNGWKKRRGRIS